MCKLKSHRGAAKRFRKTKNGFKHRKAFRAHILTKMASKRKRQLRQNNQVAKSDVKEISRLLRGS